MGYGTFITKLYYQWKNTIPIKACKVLNYVRIFPEDYPFPFVLPKKGAAFWALLFEISSSRLKKLDRYEGVHANFYNRVLTKVELKNGKIIQAFIYEPTKKTIKEENLSYKTDMEDKWQEEIKKHPEIVEKFPELTSH